MAGEVALREAPKVVALHEPQQDVIGLLRESLARAEAGDIRAIAICVQGSPNTTATTFALGNGDVAHLITACQRLNLRLLDHRGD